MDFRPDGFNRLEVQSMSSIDLTPTVQPALEYRMKKAQNKTAIPEQRQDSRTKSGSGPGRVKMPWVATTPTSRLASTSVTRPGQEEKESKADEAAMDSQYCPRSHCSPGQQADGLEGIGPFAWPQAGARIPTFRTRSCIAGIREAGGASGRS